MELGDPPAPMPAPPEPPEPLPLSAAPAFDVDRDNVTLTALLSYASEAWSRDLGAWVLAVFLSFVATGVIFAAQMIWGFVQGFQGEDGGAAVQAVNGLMAFFFQVLQTAVSGVFTMGFAAMGVRALDGKKANLGALFSQIGKVWKVIVQSFLIVVALALIVAPIVVVIGLAFIGPVTLDTPMDEIIDKAGRPFLIALGVFLPLYVYAILGIVFAQWELAYNDDSGPVSSLVYSWRIARGRRLRTLGVSLVAVLILLGSSMICGIGLLFGAPFATLLFTALYLALRNGADVPPATTASTLGREY